MFKIKTIFFFFSSVKRLGTAPGVNIASAPGKSALVKAIQSIFMVSWLYRFIGRPQIQQSRYAKMTMLRLLRDPSKAQSQAGTETSVLARLSCF